MSVERYALDTGEMEVHRNGGYVLLADYEELLAERNALAAENAGLISSSECLLHEASEVYRAYNKTQLPDGDLVDEQCLQEVYDAINATPATDAFLAEVRAQGVDMAIEHLHKKFQVTGRIGVPVMALEWLAQELRKGVQS